MSDDDAASAPDYIYPTCEIGDACWCDVYDMYKCGHAIRPDHQPDGNNMSSEAELCEEWSIRGECSESSPDCDHFGEHGPWICGSIWETRAEAEAAPLAKSPDAHIVHRFVSEWKTA